MPASISLAATSFLALRANSNQAIILHSGFIFLVCLLHSALIQIISQFRIQFDETGMEINLICGINVIISFLSYETIRMFLYRDCNGHLHV